MDSKKNVLIVTQDFPPINNIAARRFGWMCQFFEEFGWMPYIITMNSKGSLSTTVPEKQIIRIGENQQRNAKIDRSLKKKLQINSGLSIPIPRLNVLRLKSIDNTLLNWYLLVKGRLEELLIELPVMDVIVGSYPPSAPIFIAKKISRKTGAPWIADFRDLGALGVTENNKRTRWIDRMIERNTLHGAGAITTISNNYRKAFEESYNKRVETVYNGFHNREDTDTETIESYIDKMYHSSRDYLHHAGRLYEHRMEAVKLLIKALKFNKKIDFIFRSLGPSKLENELTLYAQALGVIEQIKILQPVDPLTIELEQQKAFANVVFEDLDKNKKYGVGFLSGKFLQLLPGTVPVLSICRSDNEMSEILEFTKKGKVCSTVDQINSFLSEIESSSLMFQGKHENIHQFNTYNQSYGFCRLLDEICK